tara:strand:+ start:1316 stop:1606 length:291 start_codon:yes stop_codon:yes gene_type:complete
MHNHYKKLIILILSVWSFNLLLFAWVALNPEPTLAPTWEEVPETEGFGSLKGVPPHVQDISNRMEDGHYVSSTDQMILSDWIEQETDAWNAWVETL